MLRITKFQLFCLLLILMGPVSYIELPHRLVHTLGNNAWIALVAAIIPGFLLILMYYNILNKSTRPFPLLLEEHLGKYPGKLVGFLYIPFFILVCAFTLRLFIEFLKMNVLPATPISIFIGVLLFIGFAAIKNGLGIFARVSEFIIFVGLSFSIIIVLIAIANSYHPDRLLPVGYMSYKDLGFGVLQTLTIFGRIMPILCLGFFLNQPDRPHVKKIMNNALWSYIFFITLTTLGVIITLGTIPAQTLTFPTFNMIRVARIGAFVQNIDIIFVGIWILGIFGAATIFWFMACYTVQQVFSLKDYRFLASPMSLTIGILAILLGRNNLEVVIWSIQIIPFIYVLYFLVIPLFIFIVTLFKPGAENTFSDTGGSREQLLNKQEAPG